MGVHRVSEAPGASQIDPKIKVRPSAIPGPLHSAQFVMLKTAGIFSGPRAIPSIRERQVPFAASAFAHCGVVIERRAG